MSHKAIEKKDFISFPLQRHSNNFWLAFIIPQRHQLRKSMLGSAESRGFGDAESRVQIFQSLFTGSSLPWKVLSHLLL